MKKIILVLMLLLIISLAACNNKTEVVNCVSNPEHPDCEIVDVVDCVATPNHDDCKEETVDCLVTPEHEDCVEETVDCEVTPTDPSCAQEEVVDCKVNPTDPDCADFFLDSCEVLEISGCRFFLAIAKEGGTYEVLETYKYLSDAEIKMRENEDINAVVLFRGSTVVSMKYGAVNFDTKTSTETTILGNVDFKNPTYLNGTYNVDGVFLKTDGIFTYGLIAGVNFEVLTDEIELIPHIHTNNGYSYYENLNGELSHRYVSNIRSATYSYGASIDISPDYLIEGTKYYSYDNHYFYTSIKALTDDFNNGVKTNAVNSDSPYYNYYQYISFRSKTTYTAEELNTYVNSHTAAASALHNSGEDFINAQESVFINAAMEMAFAIHESGWGNSAIAQDKNNLFGINAYDHDPYGSATMFDSVQECIEYHAEYFLGARYFNPEFTVSYGTNFGNKYQGMNYKYASDAFWGEKIAKHYYNLDKALGFKDRNSYQLVLLNPEALGYYSANTESPVIYNPERYTYGGLWVPFVIVKDKTDFYGLQLPLGLNSDLKMDVSEVLGITDVFYVEKDDVIVIN